MGNCPLVNCLGGNCPYPQVDIIYHNGRELLDRLVRANNADPERTAPLAV